MGCLTAAGLGLASHANGAVVFSTDFEAGAPTEVGGAGAVETTLNASDGGSGLSNDGFGNQFLRNATGSLAAPLPGGPGPTAATTVNLSGLSEHVALTVEFDVVFIDSWDGGTPPSGDLFEVIIDGTTVFSETIVSNTGGSQSFSPTLSEIIFVGEEQFAGGTDFTESAYRLSFTVAHTATDVTIEFTGAGGGTQGGSNESFGLDNISVSTVIPEPSSVLLLMAGAGLLLKPRRNRR
ncbi:MAG: PEP-CTERM sorting domain-containing protein [Planctomycetota bacterium]